MDILFSVPVVSLFLMCIGGLILLAWWSRGDDPTALRLISKADVDKLIAVTFSRENDPPAEQAALSAQMSEKWDRYPGLDRREAEGNSCRERWQKLYASGGAKYAVRFGKADEKIRLSERSGGRESC
jgi:hypothetical protein